jgi:hypothetical protein
MAGKVGIDLPAGFNNFVSTLDTVQQKLDEFAMGQAETAATVSSNWGNAWEFFKTDMEDALTFAEAFLAEKGVTIKELLEQIGGGLNIGFVGGGEDGEEGEGPSSGPGSAQEQELLDTSITAWQKWIDEQRDFAKVWNKTWSQTAVNVANGFAKGFADVITKGRSFKSVMVGLAQSVANDLIAQAIKSAITQIAIQETVTAANAASSAPNPFLIPLFVGLALALFAGAVGSPGGGGGGGGGGASAGAASASAPTLPDAPLQETLATTQFSGPEADRDEEGEGGTQQSTQVINLEVDGESLVSAVIKQTKDGVGDGADTLALATE